MKISGINAIAFFIIISFFACSSSHKMNSSYEGSNITLEDGENSVAPVDHFRAEELSSYERKIVHSASISLAVENIDTTNILLESIVKQLDGYISESGPQMTILRVKSAQIDDALDMISLLGKVKSRSRFGHDVTEEYLDYQIRLDNAQKARERYLELLAKSENVQSALRVEQELERLNETIDLLKGKINRLNHLTEYSTITVELKPLQKPGLLGYVGIGLYSAVKWLFVRS